MTLPFTQEQFLEVFAALNRAVWPAQVLAYILGIFVVLACFRPGGAPGWKVGGLLGFFWIVIGAGYHLWFFAKINPAAMVFGILFLIQGALFWGQGLRRQSLHFQFRASPSGILGLCLVVYGMAGYPVLNILLGHSYPYMPVFGLTPCPTTIVSFGLLLWAREPVPGYMLVIPVLWSVIGLSAAVQLGMPEDFGLAFAATVSIPILIMKRRLRQGEGFRKERHVWQNK